MVFESVGAVVCYYFKERSLYVWIGDPPLLSDELYYMDIVDFLS